MIQILCIGNSHTAGYPFYDPVGGGNPESCYQFWLVKELNKKGSPISFDKLINRGICGDTSSGIVRRLEYELTQDYYQIVILNGGANDLGMGMPSHEIILNLEKGVQLCENEDIPVIITSIPPIDWHGIPQKIQEISQALENRSQHNQLVEFVDLFKILSKEDGFQIPELGLGDGAHLSIEGYRVVGKALCPTVLELLAGI